MTETGVREVTVPATEEGRRQINSSQGVCTGSDEFMSKRIKTPTPWDNLKRQCIVYKQLCLE